MGKQFYIRTQKVAEGHRITCYKQGKRGKIIIGHVETGAAVGSAEWKQAIKKAQGKEYRMPKDKKG